MKKNLIEKINSAKSLREALTLAENKSPFPFTELNRFCEQADFAIEMLKHPKGSPGRNIAERNAAEAGWLLFRFVQKNRGEPLHQLADALDERKLHQPGLTASGHIRAVLVAANGMGRTHSRITKSGKIRTVARKITYADVLKNLRLRGVAINEHTPRIVRRVATELGIGDLQFPKPGRPLTRKTLVNKPGQTLKK